MQLLSQGFAVAAGSVALTIHPGDSNVPLPVQLTGDGTYTGPVTVTLTGLPSGVTVQPLLLTPGSSGTLLLSASVSADQEAFPASFADNADTASSTATVLAFAGAQQAKATFTLTVSLENPSFTPQPGAINLPRVQINTNGVAIADKTTNVPGTITITSADGQTAYLPGSAGADNTATFHVHGNSTSLMPKKPYDIKLNTSTDLLTAMGLQCGYQTSAGTPVCDKNKSFVLLANYDDKTLLRDWSASALANAIPIGGQFLGQTSNSPSPSGSSTLMPWASHSLFVELYLNGEYEGNYQLIEQIKVDSHRVNVTEMTSTNTSGTSLTGGYLMEIDKHQTEDYVWVTPQGVDIGLQDPDFTPEMSQQTSYISQYVNQAETALFSDTYTDPGTGWRAYFDQTSAVNFYIVNDLLGNVDGGSFYSSVYLYKDRSNPLLYMGPVWDFDISSGNVWYAAIIDPMTSWVQTQSPWYKQLFTDPSFKAAAATQWNALKSNGILANWLTSISAEAQTLQQSQKNNFGRWPMQGIRVWPNAEANGSYDGEVNYFLDWVRLRMGYMDTFLNSLSGTDISLTIPPGTLRSGTPMTLTAQVTGDHPTGTVTFSYNSIVIGSAPIDNTGTASLTATTIAPGTWFLEAYYGGDAHNAISGRLGSQVTVLAPLVQTTSSLTASGAFTYGSPVTLTAAVAGSSGDAVPTGTFGFTLNGNPLGSAPVGPDGTATFVTSTIPLGSDVLQATYSGDLTYTTSTTNSVSGVGTRGVATVTLGNVNTVYNGNPQGVTVATQPSGLNYTLTYNGVSAAPTAAGTYNVAATVSDAHYTGAATGTLTVAKAAATVSFANLLAVYNGSPQPVTAQTQPAGLSYSVTYDGSPTAPAAPGTYNVIATVDDPNYSGAATGQWVVNKATAAILLGNLNATYNGSPQPVAVVTQPAGLSYSLTYNGAASVPSTAGTYNVEASVTDPGYTGSATASLVIGRATPEVAWPAPASLTYGTPLSATQLNATASVPGSWTYTPASGALLTAGSQPLSATLTPADTLDYVSVTKTTQIVVSRQASATVLTVSAASIVPGQSVSMAATVAGATSGTPTGTLSFLDGGAVIATAPVVNGMATYSTAALLPGAHAVTATYSGDANYLSSSPGTGTLAITVAAQDFTFSNAGPSVATMARNTSALLSYSLKPLYSAYPGALTFTVTGLPPTLQYALSQNTVSPDSGPVTMVLTVTGASSTAANTHGKRSAALWAVLLLAPIAGLRSRRRIRLVTLLCAATGCMWLTSLTGCGSQAFSPPQTYHLVITASGGGMQHSAEGDLTTD